MKRELPFIVLFVAGMTVLMSYFFPNIGIGDFTLSAASETLNGWVLIVTAWLEGIAAINIFRYNAKKSLREKLKSPESFLLCLGIIVMAIIMLVQRYSADSVSAKNLYLNLYTYFVQSAGNAINALLAFYVASAAYRAFRARSIESTLMLIAAVLVMIGSAPIGEYIWSGFGPIKNWLTNVPNVAGTRALLICASVGALATSLKVLLGIERSAIGDSSHGSGSSHGAN